MNYLILLNKSSNEIVYLIKNNFKIIFYKKGSIFSKVFLIKKFGGNNNIN
jgi:hypothetical protein